MEDVNIHAPNLNILALHQVTNRFAASLKLFDDILQHPDLVVLLVQRADELFHPGL